MSQHFLLSPEARTLSLKAIMRMDDAEAFGVFQAIRFADNGGEPFCPRCGAVKVYTLAETPVRWKCSACRRKFSVTSGTLFHSRKLAIREYLATIALFTGGVKGVAALRMARDMNINPKSAFVLLHKLREAMGAEITASGELAGTVEVDGAYFGQGPKQANRKADRVDRRTLNFARQVVVVARERGGDARTWVVGKEGDGMRESSQSWRDLLLDLARRGLTPAPEIAVADGALGFWKALGEVWPTTREQRCWVRKTANPKSLHTNAKRALQEIWMAETKKGAVTAFEAFVETYQVKYHATLIDTDFE